MMTESHHKLGPAEMANLAAAYVPVRKACFAGISRNSNATRSRQASWEWRGRVVRVDRPRPTGGCRVGTPFRRPLCFIAIRR